MKIPLNYSQISQACFLFLLAMGIADLKIKRPLYFIKSLPLLYDHFSSFQSSL